MLRSLVFFIALCLVSLPAYATDYTADANAQGAWLMEIDGTETDATSNSNDATESAGDDIPQSSTKKFGTYSRDFEAGDTEYLDAGTDASLDITVDVTVCAWVYLESTGVFHTIVNKGDEDDGGNPFSYRLEITDANKGQFHTRDVAGSAMNVLGTTVMDATTWYHVCGQRDTNASNSRGYLYVNGTLENTQFPPNNSIRTNSESCYIGVKRSSNALSNYFDGLLDDVAIFDDILSSVEINDIMDNGLVGSSTSSIKTINGLAIASVKTVNGLARASVKTWNGLA